MNKSYFNTLIISLTLLFTCLPLSSQDITGKWETIDDDSGEARSVIEIYKGDNGRYYGKVVEIFPEPGEDPNPVCTECSTDDPRYNQPILGMVIIKGLEKQNSEYRGGKILDPETGNEYNCRMKTEDGKLHVRGFLGFSLIGRTQIWLPY